MFLSSFVNLLSGLVLCDPGGVCNANSAAASAEEALADAIINHTTLCRGDLCDGRCDRNIAAGSKVTAAYTGAIITADSCYCTAGDDDVAAGSRITAADTGCAVAAGGVYDTAVDGDAAAVCTTGAADTGCAVAAGGCDIAAVDYNIT